jgi:hypothetical protein
LRCHSEPVYSRGRETPADKQVQVPQKTGCPIDSPFFWRMGGKPQHSNGPFIGSQQPCMT